jgi:hypothetical protein
MLMEQFHSWLRVNKKDLCDECSQELFEEFALGYYSMGIADMFVMLAKQIYEIQVVLEGMLEDGQAY